MKLTEITFQAVKNLGNFESVRASVTYSVDGESVAAALEKAKEAVDTAFNQLYEKRGLAPSAVVVEKEPLEPQTAIFERVKRMLKDGETTLDEVQQMFTVSPEVLNTLL